VRLSTLLFALACLGFFLPPLAGQPPAGLTAEQTPTKPAPAWLRYQSWFGPGPLRLIDQGRYDPRLKGYLTPEGIKVEIVAEHPTVTSPAGMTFAEDGTPYVLEWRSGGLPPLPEHPLTFTYKDGTTRTVATSKKRVLDVVKMLRDTRGHGIFDQATVVLEEESPSSILRHDERTTAQDLAEQDRIEVSLAPGWNTMLVKVVAARAAPGLSLPLVGHGLRPSRLPRE
jgi:hypothetical protein